MYCTQSRLLSEKYRASLPKIKNNNNKNACVRSDVVVQLFVLTTSLYDVINHPQEKRLDRKGFL